MISSREELRRTVVENVSIVEVASRYLQLKKRGRHYVALCPFHHERNPSFTVTESKRMFYCFGCGVGGDVIKLVALLEGIDYWEAAGQLAEELGLKLEKSVLPDICEVLLKFMRESHLDALENVEKGGILKRYLEDRGYNPEQVVKRFKLGLLTPSLVSRLSREELFVLSKLGVVGKAGELKSAWDNRLLFPITTRKKLYGFVGRTLDGKEPKYLNAARSKTCLLYPLNLLEGKVKESGKVWIVEGCFDALRMHVKGYKTAVAVLGSHLTRGQLLRLYRMGARKFTLVPDPDRAGAVGFARSVKLIEELKEEGCRVSVSCVLLPSDDDVDAYLASERKLPDEVDAAKAVRLLHSRGLLNGRDASRVLRTLDPTGKRFLEETSVLLEVRAESLVLAYLAAEGENAVSRILPSIAERAEKTGDTVSKMVLSAVSLMLKSGEAEGAADADAICRKLAVYSQVEDPDYWRAVIREVFETDAKRRAYVRLMKERVSRASAKGVVEELVRSNGRYDSIYSAFISSLAGSLHRRRSAVSRSVECAGQNCSTRGSCRRAQLPDPDR